jgi:glycine dehydrogenase subunit 1
MSLLGFDGLRQVAAASQRNTARLSAGLCEIGGIERLFEGPFFHEVALRLDRPVGPVLEALAARQILGGLDLGEWRPELGQALLVCATETKTDDDIDAYVAAMRDVFNAAGPDRAALRATASTSTGKA